MPVITMPKLSDTMVEGTIARWIKKAGDKVEIGDVLAEVETDKATMEMEAFDDGVLSEIFVADGGSAKVGEKLALLLAEGETAESASAAKAKVDTVTKKSADAGPHAAPHRAPTHRHAAHGQQTRIKASPLAKKIAAERGASLAGVTGTGPGGRIVAADVPTAGASAASSPSIKPPPPGDSDQSIALSSMRKVIADRLLASKREIPHFYLSVEIDAGALSRVRRELNSANEAAGLPKLTVNDFILLAVSRAALAVPAVNAAWAGESITQYSSVHLAVAVAVDDGLITPVIRDAQKLTLREISAAVKDLAGRARTKKLKPEEFQGGTITISNLGAFGVEQFYAIVNPPQAAILAIGAIVKKPVVNAAGEIVVGERMSVSLSGDHRVVDGAVGAQFLAALRRMLENPALMLF